MSGGGEIARHQKLEDNDFRLLREIYASLYPFEVSETKVDFSSPETYLSTINSGRLSFVFLAKQGDNEVFLKMVKPGFIRENVPFSVLCTEECRLHSSIPTFRTFRGKNNELYQRVPDFINGNSSELSFFAGQIATLTESARKGIDEIPEALNEIPGGRKGKLALMEQLGAYIVKVSRSASAVTDNLPEGIITDDPAGFIIGRKVAIDDFGLSESTTHLRHNEDRKELRDYINSLLPNLGNSPEARSFHKGLERGDLESILDCFNLLEKKIHYSLLDDPSPDVPINNEVKPSNVGAVYDYVKNRWKITQSFDFDNMGFGTPENGDKTPLEKDLGRTLSFFAFDSHTGAFYPENVKATIKGYLERLTGKMSEAQIIRLENYTSLGIVTSYLWRSSYLAHELQGNPIEEIKLLRIDPGIHVIQIREFEKWLRSNSFISVIENLQNTQNMQQHHEIERKYMHFRGTSEYYTCRELGRLCEYDLSIDKAHNEINHK